MTQAIDFTGRLRSTFPGYEVRVDLYEQGGAIFTKPIAGGPIRLAIWRNDEMVESKTIDDAMQEMARVLNTGATP